MRTFTLEQYVSMSESFNKMDFETKIKTIIKNKDILTLASDGNWWGVKVKDKNIQEQLNENDLQFEIEREWDSHEMCSLVYLLGIDNTDI